VIGSASAEKMIISQQSGGLIDAKRAPSPDGKNLGLKA
jgi:hypothetical protein